MNCSLHARMQAYEPRTPRRAPRPASGGQPAKCQFQGEIASMMSESGRWGWLRRAGRGLSFAEGAQKWDDPEGGPPRAFSSSLTKSFGPVLKGR